MVGGNNVAMGSVGVIGAGPVGLLTSLMLSERGYSVTVFDYRDFASVDGHNSGSLRSINLALSNRGINSIRSVDSQLCDRILSEAVPMKGRMIHEEGGKQDAQLYGLHGEVINSIDRALLNHLLLEEVLKKESAGTYRDIVFLEKHKLQEIKFSEKDNGKQVCSFKVSDDTREGLKDFEFDFVIGCDGSYSQTREQIADINKMEQRLEAVNRRYVELKFQPKSNGTYIFSENYLHIWPKDDFMLIALPNSDGSFTSTFFGSNQVFDKLMEMSQNEFEKFISLNFPDVLELVDMKVFIEFLYKHEGTELTCRSCYPYHIDGGKALILGDAAHSMVPFYGQGLNCGFEDVRILKNLLEENKDNKTLTFTQFSELRAKDHAAIIGMSKRNYQEMSHDVVSSGFLIRKYLDTFLNTVLGDYWIPQYTMVTFREDIPYSEVLQTSILHKKLINVLLFTTGSASVVTILRILKKILNHSPNDTI